ncbi:MAG: hypothetical protein FGM58_02685 [Acidimicrobiia bacterium]|nr:hypothetical protein [Acidimicrobiia bacterium]
MSSTTARIRGPLRALGRSPLLAVVVALVIAAATWLVVRTFALDWHPMGDYRNLQFRVADVGGAHTPLVGPWSRFDWNHPGPWVFWLLAGPYRVFGDAGILLGAAAVNLASIVAAIAVSRGAGRRWTLVVAVTAALLCGGIGLGGLADPWNPYLVVLPTFAMGVGAWRAIDGSRAGALLAVIAGSFAAATHFGSVPLAASMVGLVALVLVWRAWRGPDRDRDVRTLLWCALAGLVLWLPPLIEQVTSSPGNLRLLTSFVLEGGRDGVNGFGSGLRIMARSFGGTFDWITGHSPSLANDLLATPWAIPLALLALAVAVVVAVRRRDRTGLNLCAVAAVATIIELAAMSRISGPLFPALVRTTWSVAALVWMAVLGVAVGAVAARRDGERRMGVALTAVLAVALAALLVRGIDTEPLGPPADWAAADAAITAAVVAAIAGAPAPVLVVNGFWTDGAVGTEVLAAARAAGYGVHRASSDAFIVGPQRTVDPGRVATTIAVVADGAIDEYLADPAWRLIVRYDALSAGERAELVALEAAATAGADTEGMTAEQAQAARRAALDRWSAEQSRRTSASTEYARWRELSLRVNLAAFERSGPP